MLQNRMADQMEISDKDCDLPEVPSFVEDATVVKYLKGCADVTPLPDTTLKELMDNSTQFPRYIHLQNMMSVV
jgi:hypothetical protein